jgi:hypothetical protein
MFFFHFKRSAVLKLFCSLKGPFTLATFAAILDAIFFF